MYVCKYNLICTILDDDLRSTDAPALPFQAFGALGMARLDIDTYCTSLQMIAST